MLCPLHAAPGSPAASWSTSSGMRPPFRDPLSTSPFSTRRRSSLATRLQRKDRMMTIWRENNTTEYRVDRVDVAPETERN